MWLGKHIALREGSYLDPTVRRSLGNEQGLALVITLFVVALVAVLVLEYHFDAAVELDLAANYANDVQAYHLALAGVRFAQALLQRDDPSVDGPDDDWYKLGLVPACFAPQQLLDLATTGGGENLAAAGLEATNQGDVGCVSLRITDEDSKLPVNALMLRFVSRGLWVPIFQDFFASFKINPPDEVMSALSDWITAEDIPRPDGGAERSYYERLPVPYKPPYSQMRTHGELRLVKGLDNPAELAKLFPGATPEAMADIDLGSNSYLTPFGPDPTAAARTATVHVNVNTALPEVLTALIEGSGSRGGGVDDQVQQIVAQRQKKQWSSLPPGVSAQVADFKSTYFRIESVGVVGVVHKKIVAVLKRSPSSGPPRTRTPLPNQPMTMLYFKVE